MAKAIAEDGGVRDTESFNRFSKDRKDARKDSHYPQSTPSKLRNPGEKLEQQAPQRAVAAPHMRLDTASTINDPPQSLASSGPVESDASNFGAGGMQTRSSPAREPCRPAVPSPFVRPDIHSNHPSTSSPSTSQPYLPDFSSATATITQCQTQMVPIFQSMHTWAVDTLQFSPCNVHALFIVGAPMQVAELLTAGLENEVREAALREVREFLRGLNG